MNRLGVVLLIISLLVACSNMVGRKAARNPISVEKDTTRVVETDNYRFRLDPGFAKESVCNEIHIDVENLSKTYSGAIRKEPPAFLEIVDRDCASPFDIELIRARYEDGSSSFLVGRHQIAKFKSKHENVFIELREALYELGWH